jgi:hypothetical protein
MTRNGITKSIRLVRSGLMSLLLLPGLWVATSSGQQVIVFDAFPAIPGDADDTQGQRRGLDQRILVIPVVSADAPFDPANNLLSGFDPLNPTLRQDLIGKFETVNDLWMENSYGEVSFSAEILERFYQMPRGVEHYFNPDYVAPRLTGSAVLGPNITVPSGQLRLDLRISAADMITIDLAFDVASSPFTFDDLKTKIDADLAIAAGKVTLTLNSCGANCRTLRFEVPGLYVQAGTYIHVDVTASHPEVLDALGLDRTAIELGVPRVTGVGAELPFTTSAGDLLQLSIENGVDPPVTYSWTMGADALTTVSDFITLHGGSEPQVAMTAVGGQLRLTAAPPVPGPYTSMSVSGPPALLDRLGLATSTEQDGTINSSARNTIKGDRRFIAGQAIAAYILNELTRDPAAPGPDPFPNLTIDAANDAAIRAVLAAQVDPFRIVAVIFLDAPNKRAGASGGAIPVGLRSGAFDLVHMTRAGIQIQYDFSTAATIAHETGHNIGFVDLYNNSNGEYDPALRYPEDWDIMSSHGLMAHTGVWHKEIDNGWLTATGANVAVMMEPGATGVADTEGYVLTPLELSASEYDNVLAGVPAGRTVAKAIRLPIGLGVAAGDHFLLAHNRQAGVAFSQSLPQHPAAAARGGVYITDAISRSSFDFFKPTTRNFDHPLTSAPPLVSGSVSPVIDEGAAPDIAFLMSYPAYDGLTFNIVGEIPGPAPFQARPSYLVDVTREQKGFLELSISPWGAPPWESSDIWIEHGDKAVLSTVPLTGNGEPARWAAGYSPAANDGKPLNWIRTLVTNSGTVGATAVQVRVRVNQPGGMGDAGTWVVLGLTDAVDIPSAESRILQIGWNPSVNAHTCVQVEVFRWTAALGDRDPWNNLTQENVALFQPTAASPWGATSFSFEVANGRGFAMDVAIEPESLPPGYIITLDQPFVRVDANSAVTVHGLLELDDAIIPPPTAGRDSQREPTKRRTDVFHLAAYIVGDEYMIPAGGITYVVIPSVRVDVYVDVRVDGGGNIVITGRTDPAAPGTRLEVEVRYPTGRYQWVPVTVGADGTFGTVVPPIEEGSVQVTVRIPPGQSVAPSDGGVRVVDTRDPYQAPGARGHRIDLYLGGLMTEDSLLLDAGLEWGFRYGRSLLPDWRAELEFGTAETDSDVNDGLLIRAQLHLLRSFGGAIAQPFVLAGAGIARLDGRGRSDVTELLTLGVGSDFNWTTRFALRVDLRYLRLGGFFGGSRTNEWQVQWGPAFRF